MKDTVILVTHPGMGATNDAPDLPIKLINKYFSLLLEGHSFPAAICFYTDGVKLAVKGSPVLESLKALEANGVRLILCSTCLDTFGLTSQVEVGIVGGMGDIMEAQFKAGKVISL
jgi:sulfur relay (sulfurtransferase) complex TusBCD TusD component (DsrE family)